MPLGRNGGGVMPGFADKTLWAVDMSDQAEEDRLFNHAKAIGAGAVAIRTTSGRLPTSMKRFQDNGMQVYAWRWPAVVQHDKGRYAIDEANFVAQTLIPAGLDGYIVDPESEGDRGYNDWNRTDIPVTVTDLAISFCKIIRDGAAGKPDFLFGLTSGGNYPATLHHLPWQQFVAASDALFPQLYWRARDNNNVCKKVRDGTPDTAFDACLPSWLGIAQGKPIIPIAGEISCVLDMTELAAFAKRTAAETLAKMHFYADDSAVTPALCAANKNL
jgi:hypothetical protein